MAMTTRERARLKMRNAAARSSTSVKISWQGGREGGVERGAKRRENDGRREVGESGRGRVGEGG